MELLRNGQQSDHPAWRGPASAPAGWVTPPEKTPSAAASPELSISTSGTVSSCLLAAAGPFPSAGASLDRPNKSPQYRWLAISVSLYSFPALDAQNLTSRAEVGVLAGLGSWEAPGRTRFLLPRHLLACGSITAALGSLRPTLLWSSTARALGPKLPPP